MFSPTLNYFKSGSQLIFFRFISVVLLLLFSQTVNASGPDTTKPSISAVEVRENSTLFGESFYRVFYVGAFIVYQSQYQFDSSANQVKFDSAGNIKSVIPESQFSEKRNKFFVFHQDSSFGFSYYPDRIGESSERLHVDTVIKGITGSNTFEKLLIKKPDTTIWSTNRTELKEVHIQKVSKDTPAVKVSFYYSSRLNNLKASLNPVLDSAKKMKFYKYEYVIGEFYSEQQQMLFPDMKMSCEMDEFTVQHPEEILQYIRMYLKDSGTKTD
jgi:hypothetical protein